MEFRPDIRHLVGGLVTATLLSAYLVYAGLGDPGPAYYNPDYGVHQGGPYDEIKCNDCHIAWKPASDRAGEQKCLDCHAHRNLNRALGLPAAKQTVPELTASEMFHVVTAATACNVCHIEHRPSDLTTYLKLPITEKRDPKFMNLLHYAIPEKFAGEDHCGVCHTPEERDRLEKEMNGELEPIDPKKAKPPTPTN